MYRKILVAMEHSDADRALLPHVRELASRLQCQLLLVHVADGWVARNFEQLNLAESEEMKSDRAYLEQTASELKSSGIPVQTRLGLGNPPEQIVRIAAEEQCDLIAMGSHGHRFVGDLLLGSTIHEVRHTTAIPVLLIRAGAAPSET